MASQKSHLYEGMYILCATLSDDARKKHWTNNAAEDFHHREPVVPSFLGSRVNVRTPLNIGAAPSVKPSASLPRTRPPSA